jgi:5-oxoprolinase (ATP-hydrolysing) subunit A
MQHVNAIDINCDMGEGDHYDDQLMPFITSANIACGFHAGNTGTIRKTIELALKHKVAIGAHPSFPDRENFGRRNMNLSEPELHSLLEEQLYIFESAAHALGAKMHHIKLHGALYNMASGDETMALNIIRSLQTLAPQAVLYGLSGSIFNRTAIRHGFRLAHEVFADRTYQPDGTLTPRSEPGALIDDEETALQQVLRMILEQRVLCTDGSYLNIQADTVCIHGDGRHAAQMARHIHHALQQHFITIRPFL